MHKYILFFTLIFSLVACSANNGNRPSSSGQSYADELRQRSSDTGQPGAWSQSATTPAPPPTIPPLPEHPRQVIAMPTIPPEHQGNTGSASGAFQEMASDYDLNNALASLIAFFASTPAIFIFAACVAGLAVRRKVRK